MRLKRILILLCFVELCGLLVVGLWPMTPYTRNDVTWFKDKDGLEFGEYGSIKSAGDIVWTTPGEPDQFTLEIWLQNRHVDDSNTFLAFYKNAITFSLQQAGSDLVVLRGPIRRVGESGPYIDIDNAFRPNKSFLVTVSSGRGETRIYLNGNLVRRSTTFPLRRRDLSGEMVLANDPLQDNSWSGLLQGLALYSEQLNADEVKKHFLEWSGSGNRDVLKSNEPLGLYLFSERKGSTVHIQAGTGPDLVIPRYYFVMHKEMLVPVAREFSNNWGYWKDVLINIGGFIPWGLFLCALLCQSQPKRPALALTILAGLLVSLLIEILQAFLPTRDSSMSDVISNTLGTAVGAFFCEVLVSIRSLPMCHRLPILTDED